MKCSVQDLEQKVLSCKHSICSHIQLYRTRLQNLTETMIQSATDNLTQHVNNIVSNALSIVNKNITSKAMQFDNRLNNPVNEIMQDVCLVSVFFFN